MPSPRTFDYEETRRRYAAGETQAALAREFGVSQQAISRVVNDELRARMHLSSAEYNRRKREPCRGRCGRLVWRHGAQGRARTGYCQTCYGISIATTVRETTLRCARCHEWKPDEDFHQGNARVARRARAADCRLCATIRRRDLRHANPEATRAYDREYKRRIRATA